MFSCSSKPRFQTSVQAPLCTGRSSGKTREARPRPIGSTTRPRTRGEVREQLLHEGAYALVTCHRGCLQRSRCDQGCHQATIRVFPLPLQEQPVQAHRSLDPGMHPGAHVGGKVTSTGGDILLGGLDEGKVGFLHQIW